MNLISKEHVAKSKEPILYANNTKLLRWIELAVLVGLVLVYGRATHERNLIWKDDIALWSDCTKKSPVKARTHNNLGVAYNEKDLVEQAISEAIIALKLRQNYPNPFLSLGSAYLKKGSFDMAIMSFKSALSIKYNCSEAYLGIGNVYAQKGELDLAIEAFKKAIELKPYDITPHVNLAAAYGSKGLTDKTIALLQYALTIKPDNPDIHYNLGLAYEKLAESYGKRAMSYEQKDLINKAINEYQKTLMLNPDDIQARERITKLMSH